MIESAQDSRLLDPEVPTGISAYSKSDNGDNAWRWWLWRGRRRVVALLVVCSAVLGLYAALKPPVIYASTLSLSGSPRRLRLIAPASQANENLCKTLLSAAILGYPDPMVVNWNKVFDNDKLIFGGSHIAKVDGVLNHLQSLGSEYDDDLVLLIDGFDVWFQLRPDVLIKRYYDINERADARIRKQLGKGMDAESISQRVLFSSQKRCWPKPADHPACWAVPQSSLPDDVYGLATDTPVDDEKNPYVKFRPRYLNSGMTLGPVKDVRAIFRRAKEKATKDVGFGSDQSIFAEIFGEQEFQRHVIAVRHRSIFGRITVWLKQQLGHYDDPLDTATKGTHEFMEEVPGAPFDFGIGLDYENQIMQTTVFSEYDTAWLSMNSTDHLREIALEAGVEPLESHLARTHLSPDITASRLPFDLPQDSARPSGVLPRERLWTEVPLLLNLWTGFVPAAIHHNAHRDGLKSRIQTHWNKTWFQPYARPLLDAHMLEPARPVAEFNLHGEMMTWVGEQNDRGEIATDDGGFHSFERFCNGTWAELFRDEGGSWLDPRLHFR